MTPFLVRIAHVLLRLAEVIAPLERREWTRAMRAEMLHSSEGAVLSFALGCLWAMASARATTSSAVLNSARWTLVLGATVWSALHIRLAERLSTESATVPSTLAYLAAAAIALGAFLTAVKGLRIAIVLAVPVIVLAIVVAIGADELLPRSTFVDFYRAIAIEYVVILLVAMLIAAGVQHWVERRERLIG